MAKIYLSATYKDLKSHRDAVYEILRKPRQDVISMEDYVATDDYPLHKCLSDVASSDIYVGLLGWRYGYDRTRRERFFRGARQMAALQHQGIVRVLEEELEDDEYHFFVMEYLDGGDLQQAILGGAMPFKDRLGIILSVGEALRFAHERHVIHRDIKPANILLDKIGQPRLTDFDLVRAKDTTGMTRTGMMGTIVFAAPELMFKPQEAKEPADVYGLAMTAVFVVHGAILSADVLWEAPGIIDRCVAPEAIKAVLKTGVARKVEDRYPSVTAFCQALQRAIDSDVAADVELDGKKDRTDDQGTLKQTVPPENRAHPDSAEWKTIPDSDKQPVPFRDRFQSESTEGPEMVWLPGGTFFLNNLMLKSWQCDVQCG